MPASKRTIKATTFSDSISTVLTESGTYTIELTWDDYSALCSQLDKRFDGFALHLTEFVIPAPVLSRSKRVPSP